MGDYITPAILGGSAGSMAGSIVADQFLSTFNWSKGAALAVIMIGFILATLVVFALVALAARAIIHRLRRVNLPEVSA